MTTVPPSKPAFFRSWITLAGGIVVLTSWFVFILIFVLDHFAKVESPYLGILTYLGLARLHGPWLGPHGGRTLNPALASGQSHARFTAADAVYDRPFTRTRPKTAGGLPAGELVLPSRHSHWQL